MRNGLRNQDSDITLELKLDGVLLSSRSFTRGLIRAVFASKNVINNQKGNLPQQLFGHYWRVFDIFVLKLFQPIKQHTEVFVMHPRCVAVCPRNRYAVYQMLYTHARRGLEGLFIIYGSHNLKVHFIC